MKAENQRTFLTCAVFLIFGLLIAWACAMAENWELQKANEEIRDRLQMERRRAFERDPRF